MAAGAWAPRHPAGPLRATTRTTRSIPGVGGVGVGVEVGLAAPPGAGVGAVGVIGGEIEREIGIGIGIPEQGGWARRPMARPERPTSG